MKPSALPCLPDLLQHLDALQPDPAARAVLRDLAWLLFAPGPLPGDNPMFAPWLCPTHWYQRHAAGWTSSLLELARKPGPLVAAVTPAPRRLGLYAEALLAFWLDHCADLQLLLRHQPLRHERRTVGEFDVVLRDADGLIHLELAVKFFLGLPGAHALQHWPGTSLDDSLASKWGHLVQHQLQLADHPAAARVLPGPVSRRWCWFKGWLFHPLSSPATHTDLAADHCRGVWGTASELLDYWGPENAVAWLPLLQRLAPARPTSPPQPLAAAVRGWQDSPRPHPRLLARVEPGPAGMEEVERAFIVPDDWLARASLAGFSP